MARYEYRIVDLSDMNSDRINSLAAEGWRVVAGGGAGGATSGGGFDHNWVVMERQVE